MKKYSVLFIIIILCTSGMSAQEQGFSFGLGGEVNFISLGNMGLGVMLGIGYRISDLFSFGVDIRGNYGGSLEKFDFYNEETILSMELAAFFRLYFLRLKKVPLDFFIQADGGVFTTFKGSDSRLTRGSPEGGGTFGFRFTLPLNLFIETRARAGYPYIGGAGLMVGLHFPKKTLQKTSPPPAAQNQRTIVIKQEVIREVEVVREVEVIKEVGVIQEIKNDVVQPAEMYSIFFYGNSEEIFHTKLDWRIREENDRILDIVSAALVTNTKKHAIINGNANPVTNTKEEEEETLQPLSIKRSVSVADELIKRGTDKNKITYFGGAGGLRPAVHINDKPNWQLNRRVDILVYE